MKKSIALLLDASLASWLGSDPERTVELAVSSLLKSTVDRLVVLSDEDLSTASRGVDFEGRVARALLEERKLLGGITSPKLLRREADVARRCWELRGCPPGPADVIRHAVATELAGRTESGVSPHCPICDGSGLVYAYRRSSVGVKCQCASPRV